MVAVLDYGIGNLRSAQKALEAAGADARLTADHEVIAAAAGVVLPGVGAFGRCMEAVHNSGIDAMAVEAAASGRPFLGICVGLQMLYEASDESPGVAGLGILAGRVTLLPDGVKRPQMQWNRLDRTGASALLDGLGDEPWVYFVHSYAPADPTHAVGTCDYGGTVVAAVERDNVWGCQFHPEKSGVNGLRILRNFVQRCAAAAPARLAG
ncbi:MAG: imidazole glycerol phosphate synthase subunit HisH [Acidimicrobiales bacterium]|nr:imidazole glycerol phosphate synthase subunit HisH [Acidimicrobiales bacterium]